ncbi:uncharacterized protein HMPREF1541_03895 [Cyphellophora europaea CBS 101466]|uniref:Methyltransferase n=1 Tax=Cyphellophora europaea (strain CBS 101466) TaxID=1220924 RepID=W2RZQ3_CYPE1|nr:uncharacterized protein HMPREF1541_03895 [Cyphellophora europaea CBS 101466]ETN41956.1 hypothetical protein HMPREF1541_03895 [Cyphellophora europaea CBS 101466]
MAVATTLNYEAYDGRDFYPGTSGAITRAWDPVAVNVNNIRGREDDFSLDKSGFEFHRHTSACKDWNDKDSVRDVVYEEVIQLLKQRTGASHVHPCDHLVRGATYAAGQSFAQTHGQHDRLGFAVPSRMVHVDQSYTGAVQYLRDNLSATDADKLAKTRWAIINIWRPLKPVRRDPFAVCDGSTVPDSDLREQTAVLTTANGKYGDISKGDRFNNWVVKKGEGHRWYYMEHMTPEEVVLIKCFDSKMDGRVRRAPHSAFVDERYEGVDEARESCEVRCLVFWEGEDVE